MGNTNIDSLVKIKLGPVKSDGTRDYDITGKESTAEAEAAVILEINGKNAKIFTKFGKCTPAERTLDQWFCTILNNSMPMEDADEKKLQQVRKAAMCIFPVNESDYIALSLRDRLQIVMGMANWVTDLNAGIRYHNDRDQFYQKMHDIMPHGAENDAVDNKITDLLDLENRFHEYATACCKNNVALDQQTFTKRVMFSSISDLAVYLLTYYVERNWMLQRCPVCDRFFRSPSLKRETCSEECKKDYVSWKRKNLSAIEKSYISAKSNLDRKYSVSTKRKGMYVGSKLLKKEFAVFLNLSEEECKQLNMESKAFDDQNIADIREWLKRRMVVVKREERNKAKGASKGEEVPSYEDVVLKFRELLSALKYDSDYDVKSYYQDKEKKQ